MSDYDKLIEAKRRMEKAKDDCIKELADFLQTMTTSKPEDMSRSIYLHGRAYAICTALAILNDIISTE